jgi:energy-coupling factor transport system ATP-binding protein
MIRLRGVTFAYPGAAHPVLRDLDLDVDEGALLVVAGPSGAGKSTLLRTLNGLVPHYSGGTFTGSIEIFGRDVTGRPPREMAGLVGFVPQDPWSHATADRVVPELAFAMENLGVPPARMRKRVEEVLDQLGLAGVRDRTLDSLSGGERQRVAIGAVLAAQPRVLVLDEPTSNLDPGSAEEVLSMLVRMRDELGLTIVLSEHRLERVVGFADRLCYMAADSARAEPAMALSAGPVRQVVRTMPYAPPVSELGRALAWEPLPLTVREGRSFARSLDVRPPAPAAAVRGECILHAEKVRFSHNGAEALRGVSLGLHRGELTALVGRNGAGKTTLLRTMVGLATPSSGRVVLGGEPVSRRRLREVARRVAYVPQRAEVLLFRDTIADEIRDEGWLDRLGLRTVAGRHPWTLSAGQRLRAALGTALARNADVLLLDEPTRGLDPPGKDMLAELLHEQTRRGAAVMLVTHDVELVARAAERVVLLASGEVVADGATREVLGESLLFSSQTSKVMDDARFLTPADVLRGIGR